MGASNTVKKKSGTRNMNADEKQLVVFKLQDEEFGVNIEKVREIVRVPEITQLPRAPEFLWGISNLRGDIMPIIDTRKRFSMPEAEISERARVLVVDLDGVSSGLVVDEVNEVMRIPRNSIDNPPDAIKGVDKHFLEGVVKVDGGKRIIMTLNLQEILCAGEQKKKSSSTRYRGNTATKDASEVIEEEQLITLKVSNEEYGFFISKVREILRFTEVTRVPNTPPHVKGIITVRNNLLPIVDMRTVLGKQDWSKELSEIFNSKMKKCPVWENGIEKYLETQTGSLDVISAEDCEFGRWLESPDELPGIMIDSLKEIKAVHEDLHKGTKIIADLISVSPAEARRYYEEYLQAVRANLDRSLKKFASALENILKEEQRILVIETGGVTLGMLVDHVNEVIRVPMKIIEDVATVGTTTSRDLHGVAKLENGKRLIMILDETALISAEDMELLEQLDKQAGGKTCQSAEKSPEEGQNEDIELLEKLTCESAAEHVSSNAESDSTQMELEEEQLVTFNLDNEEFGLRITDVQEINRLGEITQLPKAPSFVEGVTNLRGDVVPVIDLRKRFNMPPAQRDDRTRIIITDMGGRKTGLIVDRVNEVMRMPKRCVESAENVVAGMTDADFVEGIGKLDKEGRMIILLNTEKILTRQETNLLKEMDKKAGTKRKTAAKSTKQKKKKQTGTGKK